MTLKNTLIFIQCKVFSILTHTVKGNVMKEAGMNLLYLHTCINHNLPQLAFTNLLLYNQKITHY